MVDLQGPVVAGQVRAPGQRLAPVEAVDVEGQQLEQLWQDKLPGGRGGGAVLAVARQDVGSPRHQLLSQLKKQYLKHW